MKLPVLEGRAPETTLCTYCPKLCRPACPVSTVEGRETVTPWGKMRAMGEVAREVAPADAAHMAPAYACTGCMRCREYCDLDNPAAETLRDARIEALRLGVAPEGARSLVEGFRAREAKLREAARALPNDTGRVALFPGCTSVVFSPEVTAPLARAVARLEGSCAIVADACCGLPLLEAGDSEGFAERARALAARLGGYDRVVVNDAGCAHAMRVIYPTLGAAMPEVRHVAEVAAASLAEIPPLADPPRDAVYHDSCRLGRGLGVYDEPRAVLRRLLGKAPIELPDSRNQAPCSGGGGLLSRTRPATSRAIAGDVAGLVSLVGGASVVTGCATSRRQFARAGVPAHDLGELVARAFDAGLRVGHGDR